MYPHVFVHVEGEEQILTVSTDEGNEMSRSNAAEVEQVGKKPSMSSSVQSDHYLTTKSRMTQHLAGNTKLLRCDRVWKKLISHYEQRQCLKTTEKFPPLRKSRQQIMEEYRLRNEIRYRDTMFLKGEATSFKGDYDAVEPTSGHFRGRGRRGGRRRKMRFGVGQHLENNVAFDLDSD